MKKVALFLVGMFLLASCGHYSQESAGNVKSARLPAVSKIYKARSSASEFRKDAKSLVEAIDNILPELLLVPVVPKLAELTENLKASKRVILKTDLSLKESIEILNQLTGSIEALDERYQTMLIDTNTKNLSALISDEIEKISMPLIENITNILKGGESVQDLTIKQILNIYRVLGGY